LSKEDAMKITAAGKKRLLKRQGKKAFALPSKAKLGPRGGAPKGAYPIDTPERARAALHYAAMWHGKNSTVYQRVKRRVCGKYPYFPICRERRK